MKKGIVVFFSMLLMAGCALMYPTTASIYPVQGPLAEKPTVIKATFTSDGTGYGKIKCVLPDGEICEGEYSNVSGGSTSVIMGYGTSTGTTVGAGTVITSNDWVTVFGQGYFVENKQKGMATAIGNKGTVMSVEYLTDVWTGHGYGIGKDNKGNLFRVHF